MHAMSIGKVYATSALATLILAGCGGGGGGTDDSTSPSETTSPPSSPTPTTPVATPPTTTPAPTTPQQPEIPKLADITGKPSDVGEPPPGVVTPEVPEDTTLPTPPAGQASSCALRAPGNPDYIRTNCLDFAVIPQIPPGFYVGKASNQDQANNPVKECSVHLRRNGSMVLRQGDVTYTLNPTPQQITDTGISQYNTMTYTLSNEVRGMKQGYKVYDTATSKQAWIGWSGTTGKHSAFVSPLVIGPSPSELVCEDLRPVGITISAPVPDVNAPPPPPILNPNPTPEPEYKVCEEAGQFVYECNQFERYVPNIILGRFRGQTLEDTPRECYVNIHREMGIAIGIPTTPGGQRFSPMYMIGPIRPDGRGSTNWTAFARPTNPVQESAIINDNGRQVLGLVIYDPFIEGSTHMVASIIGTEPNRSFKIDCTNLEPER